MSVSIQSLLFNCSVVSDSFATPWIVACQAPLSMGFPRQEYWGGLPFSPLRDLPDPGIEPNFPESPLSPALAGGFFTTASPGKPKTTKNQTSSMWNNSLQDTGHLAIKDSNSWETGTNEGSSARGPLTALREFPDLRTGRGSLDWAQWTPWVSEAAERPGWMNCLELTG